MGDRLGILRVVSSFFPLSSFLSFAKHRNELEAYSRQYRLENTGSRPITAVKLDWAELVLGWETA